MLLWRPGRVLSRWLPVERYPSQHPLRKHDRCRHYPIRRRKISLRVSLDELSHQQLAHGWLQPVQEAIARPLFAILLGGYLREQTPVLPRSQADLISQLVDRSLQAAGLHDREARPVLGRLAVAITRLGGGRIQANEVGDPDALKDLASAGLVVMHDSLVKFPLPILLQWFSAHALGEGLVSLSEIARSGPVLDRWRYALVIAAGLFDHNRATNLLAPLARTHPGFVSQIVSEGLAEWGLDDTVPAPSGTDAADRIRQAMDAYVTGLGPLAKLIAPLQRSGNLLPCCGTKLRAPPDSWMVPWPRRSPNR